MARTTLPTPVQNEAQPNQPHQPPVSLMLPIIALVMRLVTMASLIVSTSLLASNNITVPSYYNVIVTIHFSDIFSYRYVLATSVIGLAYTLPQLLFSIHHLSSGKPLATSSSLFTFYFLADKIVLSLLATGVGAAFGVTLDLKYNMDNVDDALRVYSGITQFSILRSKLDDFFSRAYIPAIFLLFAVLSSGVSSVLSSLTLMKKPQ